jgi:hypothetical protein
MPCAAYQRVAHRLSWVTKRPLWNEFRTAMPRFGAAMICKQLHVCSRVSIPNDIDAEVP